MSINTQEYDGWIKSVLLLLRLSIIPVLIISLGIPFLITKIIMPNCNELACLFPFVITLGLQWILVIPATIFAVAKFQQQVHYYSLSDLHPIIRIGIPLILNIVAANSIFFESYISVIQHNASNAHVLQNVSVTIKEETIIPWSVPNPAAGVHYAYHVVLHVNNKSGKEIPYMALFMGAFEKDDYAWPYSNTHGIADDNYQQVIPVGEFDIISNMPIHGSDLQCNNENLVKPLYVLYSIADEYKPIAVSKSINQKLQQLACETALPQNVSVEIKEETIIPLPAWRMP